MTDHTNILNKLAKKKYIDHKEISDLQQLDFSHNEKLPIINEILIGFGAFLATLFFVGFVGAISFMGTSQKYIFSFWSFIFILLAFGCNALSTQAKGNSGLAFWRDTSACLMITGKALFLVACYEFFHSNIISDLFKLLLASIFINASLYPFYRNSIDRFISILFVLILAWIKIYYPDGAHDANFNESIGGYRTYILINAYLFFHLAILAFLSYKPKIYAAYDPIKYALIFSMLFYFLIPQASMFFFFHPTDLFKYFLCTLMVLTACGIVMELNGQKTTCLGQPLIFVLCLVSFLGLILPAEIMFSLILILYGYGHRENKILTIGLIFLPWFLFNYYYYLSASLLEKSIYLMVAGGLLISFALYYQYEIKKDKQHVKK